MSHTPGPWRAISSGSWDGVDCWFIQCQKKDTRRNENYWASIADVHGPQRDVITGANAHLIAASPTMYEALKKVVAELSWLVEQIDARPSGGVMQAFEAAKAALAKAEGKS